MIFFVVDTSHWSSTLVRTGLLEEFVVDIVSVVFVLLGFFTLASLTLTLFRHFESLSQESGEHTDARVKLYHEDCIYKNQKDLAERGVPIKPSLRPDFEKFPKDLDKPKPWDELKNN